MIAISNESGALLKVIPLGDEKVIGYSPLFGFTSEDTYHERISNRRRHGFNVGEMPFQFTFGVKKVSGEKFSVVAPSGCEVASIERGWQVKTPRGLFVLSELDFAAPVKVEQKEKENFKRVIPFILLLLLIPIGLALWPQNQTPEAPKVIEEVTIKIKAEKQKPVSVSSSLQPLVEKAQKAQEMKRAIKQNLGFLTLLGRKDLTKAVGGAPTKLKDASPGAGAGGKEGSGGEYLVGLGEGLKRVTVGNTGVAGLGGVGTRGAGGGQGGYGNSMIGSGEGKAISTIPLSEDVVLEGGLDRSVVQATIAKYLSQVRACYEQGLKNNPGLGGQVTMAFEIGGMGSLNFARVQKTTLGDPQVEQCISTRMMGWKFPNPRGGVNVKVTYPFLLRSTKT